MALAVGLQAAPPQRLRFLVASDSAEAVADFTEAVTATLAQDFPAEMGVLDSPGIASDLLFVSSSPASAG